MARQIALLRGINVGGRRKVAMADLRELLSGLGYGGVLTHLQSGNVVLTSDAPPEKLGKELERHIAAHLGVDPKVVVRTRDELADVVARNPLGDVATDPKRYQVSFLSDQPDPAVAAELAAIDVAPEQLVLSGREIFAWHPDGIRNSALVKAISERRLGVTATARNWTTVTRLLELADS